MKITSDNKNIFAVIIAIENYRHSDISSVVYAENDANAFKNLLITEFGAKEENIILWINENATKTALEEELPYHIRQLSSEDKFIFYYAGHGFHYTDSNRLTVWDTHKNNLFGTTTSIQDILLNPLGKSECENSLIFIDSCSTQISDDITSRDLISSMSTNEFEEFSNSSNTNALFCSCSPGEKSYPSEKLKHGIWTWHLIESLKGNIPEAIFKDVFVTDSSLQNYLRMAVPEFITRETTIKGTQTPFSKISSTNTKIIKKIIPAELEVIKEFPQLRLKFESLELRNIKTQDVKDLSGFDKKKKHFPPKYVNFAGNSFIQSISIEEIQEEIQEIYENSKEILNLKRRDIIKNLMMIGSIENNIFRYYLEINQHHKNPALAVITRRLIIRVPRSKLPINFHEIFPIQPNKIVIPIDGEVDFDDLVERFENLEESVGGQLQEDDVKGTIEYISEDNLTITINTIDKEMIINPNMHLNCLKLIDIATEGLKKITGQNDLLLLS